ncbi:MAG: Wzz/FepE/Etk N-terminal domain-containing protein [Pseudomonadota bacterium]
MVKQVDLRGQDKTGNDVGSDITVADLCAYLWWGRTKILASAILACAVSIAYFGSLARTTYTATATVRLDASEINVVDVEEIFDRARLDAFLLNTERYVIESARIIEKVVEVLALTDEQEFDRLSKYQSPTKKLRALIFGEEVRHLSAEEQRHATEDAVRAALDIKLLRDTYILEVKAKTGNRELSAKLANALVDAYIVQQREEKTNKVQEASVWLAGELQGLSQDLLQKDQEITALRATVESSSDTELHSDTRQIRQMRARLIDLSKEHEDLRQQLESAQKAAARDAYFDVAMYFQDSELRQIAGRVATGSVTARMQAAAYTDALLKGKNQRLEVFRAQMQALEVALLSLNSGLDARAEDLNRLEELERAHENTEALHDKFSNRLREAILQFGLVQPDARILKYAKIPLQPSGPLWLRTILGATVAGALTGALMVLLKELALPSIRSPRTWRTLSDVPLVAGLPSLNSLRRSGSTSDLISALSGTGARALRELRTRLSRYDHCDGGNLIMVTGSGPKDNQAQVAAALAGSFASLNCSRVLLVDFDMRLRPLRWLDKKSGAEHTLADLLKLGNEGSEVLVATEGPACFDYIPAGYAECDPLDLLDGLRHEALLHQFVSKYDHVIVCLPPLTEGVAVPLLARLADHLIYCARWRAPQARVLRGLSRLSEAGCSATGAVLTDVAKSWLPDMIHGASNRSMAIGA